MIGITLLLSGVLAPPAAAVDTDMAISTTAIDFGQVNVGSTAQAAVTLTNTGGDPFGPVNMFGGAPPTNEFNASQNCQGTTLPAGGSCMVNYTFSPGAAGTFNDSSNFTVSETPNQADGEDFSVSLTGVGFDPNATATVDVTPLTLDFDKVDVGATSLPMSVQVTNTSTSLSYGPIGMAGGEPPTNDFTASQNCVGVTLAVGASCQITYLFTPTAAGPRTDSSDFTISQPNPASSQNFSVALAGLGVARHARTVTIELVRNLVARGEVATPDAFGPCESGITVKIQRRREGKWRTVDTTVTDALGLYREPIPDRAGRHRALIDRLVLDNGANICHRAHSPGVGNR
jgi:hypothetical protein